MKSLRNKYLICALLAALMVISFAFINSNVYAANVVKIGHAASGEKGSTGNTPGDQTGKEVYTMNYTYSSKSGSCYNWTMVVRCKNTTAAQKMAKTCIDACNNAHVGYDRGTYAQRQSFFNALKAAGWDATKITKDVETSCTPFIAALANAAGYSIKTDYMPEGLKNALVATGDFVCYTSKDYTASSDKLQPGDILLCPAHGAMVVSVNGTTKVTTTTTTVSNSELKVGQKYSLLYNMRVRSGPGTDYSVLKYSDLSTAEKKNAVSGSSAVLKAGTSVTCKAVKGNWIKTQSGWIAAISDGESNIAKETKASTSASTTTKTTKTTKTTTTSTKVKVKKGKNYKLATTLYVRTGPGTQYSIKNRSELTKDAQKHAKNTKNAILKKGTVVTCLKVSGNWMKIPSGWICCKKGNVTYP